MNRIYLSFFSFLIILSFNAQSPISLSNTNMPGANDTLRYSIAKLSSLGNYTLTGTNFTWDFSLLEFSSQGIREYKSAPATPYAFFFSPLDYGEKIADTLGAGPFTMTDYYNFYKKQSSPNSYIADGVGVTYSGFPIPNYYSDKDELYNFPMTYPKYDSTTFKFSTTTNTMIPFKYSKTGYRVTVVDGWGTITTPFGTASCLRLITTQYSQDSVKTQFGNFGFPNNQRSYQWLTSTSKIPYLEVNGAFNGGNFTPALVRYRDLPRVVAGIKSEEISGAIVMYPNPVKNELHFSLNENEVYNIEIIDLTGKTVITQKNERPVNGNVSINLKELASGFYTVKVRRNAGTGFLKFIKE